MPAKFLQDISRADATNALKGQPATSPGQNGAERNGTLGINMISYPSPYRGKSQTISKVIDIDPDM